MKILVKKNEMYKKLRGYEYRGIEIRLSRGGKFRYSYKLAGKMCIANVLKDVEKAIDNAFEKGLV